MGKRNYELSNHLGNVQVVISDKRISVCDNELQTERFEADILMATDYYPFGMAIPERQWYTGSDSSNYRFGFNGMEKDNEAKGPGNSLDFGARIYDSRLGRRWKTDPVVYPMESPYASFRNNPIFHSDPNGNLHISKNAVATAKSSFKTTVSTLKVKKGIGAVASVGAGVISFYLYIEEEISGAKMTVDFVMPGVALVPDLGWVVSGAYFIVDGTIGRDNAFETFNRLDSEHSRVTGKGILQGPIW